MPYYCASLMSILIYQLIVTPNRHGNSLSVLPKLSQKLKILILHHYEYGLHIIYGSVSAPVDVSSPLCLTPSVWYCHHIWNTSPFTYTKPNLFIDSEVENDLFCILPYNILCFSSVTLPCPLHFWWHVFSVVLPCTLLGVSINKGVLLKA